MMEGLGLDLLRSFFEARRTSDCGALPLAARCGKGIGFGSEVLGCDAALAADHDYAPCMQIFLQPTACWR